MRWIYQRVCDAWPVRRQTCGYLPSLPTLLRASLSFGRYQIILLGDLPKVVMWKWNQPRRLDCKTNTITITPHAAVHIGYQHNTSQSKPHYFCVIHSISTIDLLCYLLGWWHCRLWPCVLWHCARMQSQQVMCQQLVGPPHLVLVVDPYLMKGMVAVESVAEDYHLSCQRLKKGLCHTDDRLSLHIQVSNVRELISWRRVYATWTTDCHSTYRWVM